MKKSRLLIVLLIVAVVCLSLVACSEEHTHSYEWTIETAPTATTKGVATGKCSCGVTTAVALPVLTDTSVWTVDQAASTAATCQAEGSTVYTSVYGKVAVAEAKTEHKFGKFSITTTPTETVPGIAEKVCTVSGCGHKEQLELPVLTDSSFWTLTETAASHTQKGSKVYANASYELSVTIELAQIAHNFQKIADEKYLKSKATCESPATYYYSCECGAKSDETFTVGTANGHVYGSWALVGTPTSEAGAEATRKCLVCGKVETMSVPALTNTEFWTVNTVASTHKVKGSSTYTNSEYGFEVVVELALIPHTFDKKVESSEYLAHEADCTHAATYYYSCECGEAGESTFTVGKVQHQWGEEYSVVYEKIYDSEDWNAEPTLEPTEYHARVCTVCGEVDKDNKEKHTYEVTEVITHADTLGNGTVQGYSVVGKQACSVCGYNNGEEKPYGYINIENPERSDYTLKSHVDATYEQAGYDEYVKKTDETFTVRIPIAKLVAPFENKSYSLINAYFNDDVQTRTASYTDYNSLTVAVDGKGEGSASAYPFNGSYKFTMVDAATGKISAELTRGSTKTVFEGYVSEIGVIVLTSDNYQNIYVLSPYGITTSDVKACRFAGTTLIYYHVECNTHIGHDYNIAIIGDEAHFDVAVTDFDGNDLPVSEVVTKVDSDVYTTCNFVQVASKDGTVLAAYVSNGTTLVEADGLQGKYAVDLGEGQGTLALSGNGTFTFGSKSGTYTVAEGQAYSAELFVVEGGKNVAYYQLTIAEGVASAVKPMVTVTFEVGTYGEAIAPASVNAKVPAVLPQASSNNEQFVFGGWYLDAACSEDQAVSEDFAPEQNVTVYAKWGAKVLVNVIDVQNPVGTVYIASGSALSVAIPEANEYTENQLSADGKFFFAGWFVDSNGNGVVDNEESEADLTAVVNYEDFPSGVTVIANWTAVPAYAGTYYGTEVYGKSNTSGSYGLTIDQAGNIKYFEVDYSTKQPKYVHEGYVVGYDAETGVLTWKQTKYNNNTNEKDYTVYFDEESMVFLGFYDNKTIGTDFLFFSKALPIEVKPAAVYAIKVPSGSSQGYYGRIVVAPTALGENTIVYSINNKIYSNVTITNALGETLTVADKGDNSIGASSTIVIKDSEGNTILARGNQAGKTFADGKDTVELGAEYGAYTAGEGVLKLDGAGSALYQIGGASKKGTYKATESGYECYVVVDGVNTEYYTFTLDGTTATVVKPMVEITFVTAYGTQASIQANVNIAVTLPVLTDETHVFRGWKVTGTDTKLGETHVFTASQELTAIWLDKVTITVVYNDGTTESVQTVYGKGETVVVEEPEWAKHAFDGWFTTAAFEEGTEWTSGSAIIENITIYAKWSDAPIYNAVYTPIDVEGSDANGDSNRVGSSRTAAVLNVNTKGVAVGKGWPYRGTVRISNYDAATGTIDFDFDGKVYPAFMSSTGTIVVSETEVGKDIAAVRVLAMNYVSADTVKHSYWNAGKTRCIVYTANGVSTNIFVYENKVYFGVSFTDISGNTVAAEQCFGASDVFVKDAEGQLIAKFGFDGTTMMPLDGFEGTYTNESAQSVVLNGMGVVTIGENSGTYTAAAEGAGYTFEVFMTEGDKTVYYQLTVDKEAKTYTIVKPEVTFTFTSEYGTVETSVSVNTKVAYTLPAGLTDATHLFLGWYVTGDESQTIVTSVTPTEAMSFTAKWVEKVVLTIVYGNGLETASIDLQSGVTPDMNAYKIGWANMHLFEGWFTDEACTEAYTPAALTGNLTVYAKWGTEEVVPYTLENKDKSSLYLAWKHEGNTFTSTNGGKGNSYSEMTVTAGVVDIVVSFDYIVGSESNCDKLLVLLGTTTKLDVSGDAKTGSFSITVKAGETLKIQYKKDGSVDKFGDSVTLNNFTVEVA